MSSHLRIELAVTLAALAALGGCGRGDDADNGRNEGGRFAPAGPGAPAQRDVALVPAGGQLVTGPVKRAMPYYDNAGAVVDGMKLYGQMNCSGCHANGGGAIGPPLMDDQWIYGGRLDQIYDTIYFGRANGMPAWGGKLTDDQIWKIAAYVRSMSLPETLAHNGDGTPSQHPAPVPRASDAWDGWHVPPHKDGG